MIFGFYHMKYYKNTITNVNKPFLKEKAFSTFKSMNNIERGEERCKKTIGVVYENGVFKPLEPVEIKEGVKRRIMIEEEHFEKFFGMFKDKEISVEEERDLMIKENSHFRPGF